MAKFSLKLTKRYLRDLKLARKCDIIKKIADEQRLACWFISVLSTNGSGDSLTHLKL